MKKISIFIQLFCSIVLLSSCTEDKADFVVSKTTPVVLSDLNITNVQLDGTNPNNPAITLNWTAANYGQQTSVKYNVEVSSTATFTNPVLITSVTGGTTATLSVTQLNSAAGTAGLPPFAWNAIYARVVSSIGTVSSGQVPSNTITFNVYPYFNYPYKDFYIVGNATQPGWNNNNNNPPLFRDASNKDLYNFVGYYSAGEFKVLEIKGQWQPQWGTNNGSTINVNPGGGSDPGTFPNNNSAIATAGYYKFTINYSNNTFSFTPYSTAGATTYSSMTVKGSSTADIAMTQSGFDSHLWFANNKLLVPGDLKFITNTNSAWGGTTSFSGTATLNGANIPVIVQDYYDIWFNDLTGEYIMIPLNL